MSSGCGDVLSLEDLRIAKQHQIFEAEVITGKQGGVASGADIDYATNQATGQTQKTLPAVLRDAGFLPTSFDFTTGGTLSATDRNKAVYDPVSKTWYAWGGALPKVIPAGTNPLLDSEWKPKTDPDLRSDLAKPDGITFIGTGVVVAFDNVSLMKNTAWLKENMIVRTKGYIENGDGGHGVYKISSLVPEYLDKANHSLANGLYAVFIPASCVFLEQVGGLLSDASDAFYAAMSLSRDVRSRTTRDYKISKTIYVPSYTSVDLNGSTVSFGATTYVDYFMPNGSESARCKNITIKNVKLKLFYTYGSTATLPAWNTQGHGNGIVGIRMKYCDGFTIENVEAYGGHYGIEIKTSTKGTVRGCIFHDNIDDGLSVSDGGVVAVQSSDIIVELCESYSNGYIDNNVGNSGFEVDDGPRNITFYKCYAHDNESRGFACHIHGGSDEALVCYNIRFIECRAENNNNVLQTAAAYTDNNCGFGFSSASNVTKRVYDILVDKCSTSGHKQGSVLWYRSGSVTDSGLTVSNCNFNDTVATNGGIRTYLVSDLNFYNNRMVGGAGAVGFRVFGCRGTVRISHNHISGYGLGDVQIVGDTLSARVWIVDNELNGTSGRTVDSVTCTMCLRVVVSGNRISDDVASTGSAIYVGQTTSSNTSKYVQVTNNYIFGHGIGVSNRGATSLNVQGNTFENTTQVLVHIITANGVCLLQNNVFLNCGSDGASGADNASGNIAKTFTA